MEAVQTQDDAKMHKIAETNFAEQLISMREASNKKDWFQFERCDYDPTRVVTVDKLFIKGVGVDRSTNDDLIDYNRVSGMEPQGIRSYIHKFDAGMEQYYYMVRF